MIWTRFQFLCGMLFKMLVWSLLVSVLRLCSLNAKSLGNKSAYLFAMLLQLERVFLQLPRHGFLSLMMLIELKLIPLDLN